MLTLKHVLIKNIPITLHRRSSGSYVNGDWVEGSTSEIDITAQVQPLKGSELLQLPESERSREWVKVYSPSEIRVQREGVSGNDSDEFDWQGKRFKVMDCKYYEVGNLQHFKALAARIELTPN